MNKKILCYSVILLGAIFSSSAFAIEKCGSDVQIEKIGNYSSGSGGPYYGDLTLHSNGSSYEWRKRYGLDQSLLDQTLALALFAKSTGAAVDIYCSASNQSYNARYIVVK